MSSQSTARVTGIQSMQIRDASDFVRQIRLRRAYQQFASPSGANAYRNTTPNSVSSVVDFVQGGKESCATCVGLPYQYININGTGAFSIRWRS